MIEFQFFFKKIVKETHYMIYTSTSKFMIKTLLSSKLNHDCGGVTLIILTN